MGKMMDERWLIMRAGAAGGKSGVRGRQRICRRRGSGGVWKSPAGIAAGGPPRGAGWRAGRDFFGKSGPGERQSGLPEALGEGGIGEDPGQGGGNSGGVPLGSQQAGFFRQHHLWHPCQGGGNTGQGCGHGFHQHGGENVPAAIGLGDTGQGKNGGFA